MSEQANPTKSFGKTSVDRMLWPMSTLGQRIEHALKARSMKRGHLDEELARRLNKKGRGSGYIHSLVVRGHQPGPENLKAIAAILGVSHRWLLTGEGSMEPDDQADATYDSLPGWAAAADEEIKRARIADYVIRAAGRSPVFVTPKEITPDFVFQAAMFWLQHAPEEYREAAAKAEGLRRKALEDARRK